MSRQLALESIRQNPDVTVLIAGGGVNGIGLLYDLALQGVDAILVERGDYCSGTSAASTRMIHGGLRYLENSEFRLVREALKERQLMLDNAPHYVTPIPITIPIFSWTAGLIYGGLQFFRLGSKPGDRGALLIKIGLTLYDRFSQLGRVMPHHSFHSKTSAVARRPKINPRIVCTATYYDAKVTYPERLCLEMALEAEAVSPKVHALNYVSVESAQGDTVTLKDQVTGQTLTVKPKILVNATGPWIDFTNTSLSRKTEYIGGTKGSHLVIDSKELWEATQGEMLYFANTDGRILIFYPFYDKVIAGTTDIPVDDPEKAVCEESEVDYILESVRYVFPDIKVAHSDIVFRFCGVRPLPKMNTAVTGQISRDHSCQVVPPGNGLNFPIYSLVGGKWTSYRAFAEQVTDRILGVIGHTRSVNTEHKPIGGGKDYPFTQPDKQKWAAEVAKTTRLPTERLMLLLDRYGTRAAEVAAFSASGDDAPLRTAPGYTRRELEFIATCEDVVHLDDLLLRRTLIALLGNAHRETVQEVAEAIAPALGWSPEQTRQEVDRVNGILASRHGMTA